MGLNPWTKPASQLCPSSRQSLSRNTYGFRFRVQGGGCRRPTQAVNRPVPELREVASAVISAWRAAGGGLQTTQGARLQNSWAWDADLGLLRAKGKWPLHPLWPEALTVLRDVQVAVVGVRRHLPDLRGDVLGEPVTIGPCAITASQGSERDVQRGGSRDESAVGQKWCSVKTIPSVATR